MRNPTSPPPLRAATAAVLLALPLLIWACGGGEDFAAEADGICTGEAVRVNSVLDDGGTPGSAAEAAAQNAQLLPIEREATSRLRGVEAPGGSAGAAYRDFLAARRHALRLSERRARAARAASRRRLRRARQPSRAGGEGGRQPRHPGRPPRLRRAALEAADRAVRATITRIATSPDPALCSELFTANFVRAQFDRPGECRRRQRRPRSAARSVAISDLRGIDGVYALATIVPAAAIPAGRGCSSECSTRTAPTGRTR